MLGEYLYSSVGDIVVDYIFEIGTEIDFRNTLGVSDDLLKIIVFQIVFRFSNDPQLIPLVGNN